MNLSICAEHNYLVKVYKDKPNLEKKRNNDY